MNDDLLDADAACRLIGGSENPIHRATLYRGIQAGRYPAPIAVSPNVRRWRRSELLAAIEARAAQRRPPGAAE